MDFCSSVQRDIRLNHLCQFRITFLAKQEAVTQEDQERKLHTPKFFNISRPFTFHFSLVFLLYHKGWGPFLLKNIYLCIIYLAVRSQLWHSGSFVEVHELSSWGVWVPMHTDFSNCCAWAKLPQHGDPFVSRPGTKPEPPVLRGGFSTTVRNPRRLSSNVLLFRVGMGEARPRVHFPWYCVSSTNRSQKSFLLNLEWNLKICPGNHYPSEGA